MAPAERLIVCLNLVLLALCLTGLFVRRRHALCVSFTLYLGAVLLSDTLILVWPRPFHSWDFWVIKESVHNLLKFAIALELTVRTFRAFPAARKTVNALMLGVLVLLLAVLVLTRLGVGAMPLEVGRPLELALSLQPYVLAGTLWLFIAISSLILWYRLPVVPLHKALLLGFVPYLLIFTVAINLLRAFGGHVREIAGYLKSAAYVALVAYWAVVAWRRGPPTGSRRRGPAAPPPAA
jgi:hypothetical protein